MARERSERTRPSEATKCPWGAVLIESNANDKKRGEAERNNETSRALTGALPSINKVAYVLPHSLDEWDLNFRHLSFGDFLYRAGLVEHAGDAGFFFFKLRQLTA